MTGYVADLSWKSGVRAIEKLDRLRSTMAVNVLIRYIYQGTKNTFQHDKLFLLTPILVLKSILQKWRTPPLRPTYRRICPDVLQFVAKRELECLRVTILCSPNNGSQW